MLGHIRHRRRELLYLSFPSGPISEVKFPIISVSYTWLKEKIYSGIPISLCPQLGVANLAIDIHTYTLQDYRPLVCLRVKKNTIYKEIFT